MRLYILYIYIDIYLYIYLFMYLYIYIYLYVYMYIAMYYKYITNILHGLGINIYICTYFYI